jgi:poly-gamma-glutamate synthesis protein (capsule biosynthesis protein)
MAGDVLVTDPLGRVERDQTFVAVRSAVSSATFALANLEMNLLGAEEAAAADSRPAPRWPHGGSREADLLRQLGFDAVTLANDHAADYGAGAVSSTRRVLDGSGLLHAGTGGNLAEARAPLTAGRIAVFAVAASSMPDARATAARGEASGRPGVSALRYTARMTVDASTYQTLSESLSRYDLGPAAGDRELSISGTTITQGDRTSVEFAVDEDDERSILDAIRAARQSSDVVIVSLHAHEPSNAADEPAAFVRQFARAAIDAGAAIVMGHGPHRLRGVEAYKTGVILYSLGNFLYQTQRLDFRAANVFDAGVDVYQSTVDALGEGPSRDAAPPSDSWWWQSALAVATVDGGGVVGLRLIPLELGADKSLQTRGMPRAARREAAAIIERLTDLSGRLGTRLQADTESGQVQVRLPAR